VHRRKRGKSAVTHTKLNGGSAKREFDEIATFLLDNVGKSHEKNVNVGKTSFRCSRSRIESGKKKGGEPLGFRVKDVGQVKLGRGGGGNPFKKKRVDCLAKRSFRTDSVVSEKMKSRRTARVGR